MNTIAPRAPALPCLAALLLWSVLLCPLAVAGEADTPGSSTKEILDLDVEELMGIDVVVSSVSKQERKLWQTPAAVFVITQSDIRRSGATSIAELFRMVPGMQVARIDSSKWGVSARGFNNRFAFHLLVMIDGRSVYSPLSGGVFWEMQDVLLEDIERIEVIRGPGGTIWGANAVNGVIHIITKHAKDTQGGLLVAGTGTEERAFGGFRYGGKLGEKAYYRVYAKGFDRDGGVDAGNHDTPDDWHVARAGFRVDWALSDTDAFTIQADTYDGRSRFTVASSTFAPPYSVVDESHIDFSGQSLAFRWDHKFAEDSDLTVQLYYSGTKRWEVTTDRRDTLDFDLNHTFRPAERHRVTWGLGYRFVSNHFDYTFLASMDPAHRQDHILSAFIQDEITLIRRRLWFTLGSKFEHNNYTGFEMQPSARLTWTPHDRHMLWAALSRAVRTPSRGEHDARYVRDGFAAPGVGPGFAILQGNHDIESTEVVAYELGYRAELTPRLTLDLALFYNEYDRLRTIELGAPYVATTPLPHMVLPLVLDDKLQGETYGVEIAAQWRPTSWWKLDAAYTYLKIHLTLDPDSVSVEGTQGQEQSPSHQLSLRSAMDLTDNVELDLWLRYVGNLPALDVPSYVTADLRLAWKPRPDLELFLVGQNLLQTHHKQFTVSILDSQATEVQRGVYVGLRWEF